MLMKLGRMPLVSFVVAMVPLTIALVAFIAAHWYFGEGSMPFLAAFVATTLVVCVVFAFETPVPLVLPSTATFVALLIFFGHLYTGKPNLLLWWVGLSAGTAFLAAVEARAYDGSIGVVDKMCFDFVLHNGVFWSIALTLLTYTPGNWIRSYGATLFGFFVTVCILLLWSDAAARRRRR